MVRRLSTLAAGITSGSLLFATLAAGAPAPISAPILVPLAVVAPHTPKDPIPNPACTTPAPASTFGEFHCYSPAQIYAAYGVDKARGLLNVKDGLMGQGQTIVLVDSYGSPTAANDIQFFHDTYFKSLPDPNFTEWYPFGNPTANFTCTRSAGLSGPCSAAGWSFEATLDIEWAYAMAPLAHIVLLATPPAETLGVPGLPNMFKAMQMAIDRFPSGTVFSQSFGLGEQTFGGAALNQMQAFDQTYQNGINKGDSFLASSGDQGNGGSDKNHKLSGVFSFNVVGFPAVSPLVTAVGGTQLMLGWRLAPTSTDPIAFTSSATNTEPLWTECNIFGGGNCVTGGGTSSFFPAPSWQSAQQSVNKGMRSIPDLSWNAAVNGGVLVYITAYPTAIPPGWYPVGGTSASSPQMAGIIALANQLRASKGKPPLGNLGPHIYALGNADAPGDSSFDGNATSIFRDVVPQTFTGPDGTTITIDNNAWPPAGPSVPAFFATPGYDMTTGFGSPRADRFVAALAAP
jgi:subtilase family serine protease